MDGEQILVYAGIAQIVGVAVVTLLVWTTKAGRSEGVRASDIAALDKAIHHLADKINVMPTSSALKLLESELRREFSTANSDILHNMDVWRAEHLKDTALQATALALAVTNAATAAANASKRSEPYTGNP